MASQKDSLPPKTIIRIMLLGTEIITKMASEMLMSRPMTSMTVETSTN